MLVTFTTLVLCAGLGGLSLAEDPTSEAVNDAFGVPLETLRELVFKQPFVSSCQYSILKNVGMYNTAKENCPGMLEGKAKIAVIRNDQENQAIANLFVATFGHGIDNRFMRNNPSNYLWIGLSRENNDAEWQWEDDSVPYNYTNWDRGHPKDGYFKAVMNRKGRWVSATNINYHPTVCERAAKYVVYRKRLAYVAANGICTNMSMTMAKVTNESENAELARIAGRSLGSPYLEKNFQNVNQIWIGGSEGEDGKLSWEDGSAVEYQNFEPNIGMEFSGTGDVKISMDKMKRDWRLEKATEERSFACQCPHPGQDQYRNFNNDYNEPDYEVEALIDENRCKKRFYPDSRLKTFGEARYACLRQGLQLAKIGSAGENEYAVRAMNKKFKGQFQERLFDGKNWFWIGGTDDLIEGHFVWQDNTPLNYTNWGKDQPDNAHPLRGGQSKIAVYRATGHWDDGHAIKLKAFLCYDSSITLDEEKANGCDDLGRRQQPEPDKTDNTEDGTEIIDEDGTEVIDEDPEVSTADSPLDNIVAGPEMVVQEYNGKKDCIRREYRGEYYVATSTKNYEDAKRDCGQRGMELASVYNEATNARLRNLAINRVPVSAYVLATMGELSWFWVGLELNTKEQAVWSQGNHSTYENFASYYKRNKYSKDANAVDVLAISKVDGSWEWKSRNNRYMYVCEANKWVCTLEKELNIYEDVCSGTYEETTLFQYHLKYAGLEEARAACKLENMELAVPTSIKENEHLRAYAEDKYPLPLSVKSNPANKENWIWLDLDDTEEEGRYVYGNGSQVGWFNWGTSQPDNRFPRRGGQDMIAMNKNTGKWFDVFTERQFQFLCQRKVWQCIINQNLYNPTEEPTSSSSAPIANDLEFLARPQSYLANIGSAVTFSATYLPVRARVSWMLGGKLVKGSNNERVYATEDGSLVISSVKDKDEGVVSCVIFTDRHELIAHVALALAEQKLLHVVAGHSDSDLEAASQTCNGLGGSIACPESGEENALIAEEAGSSTIWLGMNAAEDGSFVLHDGRPAPYLNWKSGEPAQLDGDAGVVMDTTDGSQDYGKWSVKAVSELSGVICERVPVSQGAKKRRRKN